MSVFVCFELSYLRSIIDLAGHFFLSYTKVEAATALPDFIDLIATLTVLELVNFMSMASGQLVDALMVTVAYFTGELELLGVSSTL
jgi:hypothetical protein